MHMFNINDKMNYIFQFIIIKYFTSVHKKSGKQRKNQFFTNQIE